jgi:hypothetical protein
MRILVLLLCSFISIASIFPSQAASQTKKTVGWVERVDLMPEDLVLHAKLDTGADSSSLHASDIVEFERDGENWVRFTVENWLSQKVDFEREVKRTVRIKRHGKPSQKRNVVRIGVCLGNVYRETDVTLVDRTNFKYQMLLGRIFLAGLFAIDPAVTYTTEPRCKNAVQEASRTKTAKKPSKASEKKKKKSKSD